MADRLSHQTRGLSDRMRARLPPEFERKAGERRWLPDRRHADMVDANQIVDWVGVRKLVLPRGFHFMQTSNPLGEFIFYFCPTVDHRGRTVPCWYFGQVKERKVTNTVNRTYKFLIDWCESHDVRHPAGVDPDDDVLDYHGGMPTSFEWLPLLSSNQLPVDFNPHSRQLSEGHWICASMNPSSRLLEDITAPIKHSWLGQGFVKLPYNLYPHNYLPIASGSKKRLMEERIERKFMKGMRILYLTTVSDIERRRVRCWAVGKIVDTAAHGKFSVSWFPSVGMISNDIESLPLERSKLIKDEDARSFFCHNIQDLNDVARREKYPVGSWVPLVYVPPELLKKEGIRVIAKDHAVTLQKL